MVYPLKYPKIEFSICSALRQTDVPGEYLLEMCEKNESEKR
jgi:hypothetical protein